MWPAARLCLCDRRLGCVCVTGGSAVFVWPAARLCLCGRRLGWVCVAGGSVVFVWPAARLCLCGRRLGCVCVAGGSAVFVWTAARFIRLSQVHRARLLTGEDVVIKIQRPGLKALFDIDLGVLRQLAEQLDKQEDGPRDFL